MPDNTTPTHDHHDVDCRPGFERVTAMTGTTHAGDDDVGPEELRRYSVGAYRPLGRDPKEGVDG